MLFVINSETKQATFDEPITYELERLLAFSTTEHEHCYNQLHTLPHPPEMARPLQLQRTYLTL